jgi:hypothetical protein
MDTAQSEKTRRQRGPRPGFTQRLSDKILVAFHQACDEADFEVAEGLLGVLEGMLKRHPTMVDNRRVHDVNTLVAAHERLWQLRHPDQFLPAMRRPAPPPIPERIGPCRFGRLGSWITVQCPAEFDGLMLDADAVWEPSERRWLLRPDRLGPVLRKLHRQTDPLFRHAGIDRDASPGS